ncbi:MAG: cytochrome c [Proteobacteria bacterium]|nr:cytochrome c [Pseudomonadota bacterium]
MPSKILLVFLIALTAVSCTKKNASELAAPPPSPDGIPLDTSHAKFPLTAQANGEIRNTWQPSPREQAQLAVLDAEAAAHKPTNPQQGENLFKTLCSSCHGPDGRSGGPLADSLPVAPTNFHEWPLKYGRRASEIALTISLGRNDNVMPAFGDKLSKDEIWALAYKVSAWIEARPATP